MRDAAKLPAMATVRDLQRGGARRLAGDEARRDATLLLCHVLGESAAWLLTHADDEVAPERVAAFGAAIESRARGEPVAYLTGTRGFHALELRVTRDVLIPRPETELLVDVALQRIPVDARNPDAAAARQDPDHAACATPESAPLPPGFAVADLGTGSGAVALAIACARPGVHVLATDASDAALAVARGNAARLGLGNVAFARGDWHAALGRARFDLIISNPPYVAEGDPHLARGDLRFEPRAALVSGTDGLDAIRAIVAGARARLRDRGWLLLEHGFDQGAAVRRLLANHGFEEVFTARDLEDRERASGGRRGGAPESPARSPHGARRAPSRRLA